MVNINLMWSCSPLYLQGIWYMIGFSMNVHNLVSLPIGKSFWNLYAEMAGIAQ